MTKGQYAQWIAAAGLFACWMFLVWNQVKGAEEIIGCIKAALGAFGLYCWNDRAVSKGAAIANSSGGTFSQPPQ